MMGLDLAGYAAASRAEAGRITGEMGASGGHPATMFRALWKRCLLAGVTDGWFLGVRIVTTDPGQIRFGPLRNKINKRS